VPFAFSPKVSPNTFPTSFSNVLPKERSENEKCTLLAKIFECVYGASHEFEPLPIMHLNKHGLELVFSCTIGGDEHFLEDIERSNNHKNLLSLCRVGEAEHLHIKPPKHHGFWMLLLLDDLSTNRQPKKRER
jgi:hypothetical protein